jgi:hypothetical protein
MLLASCSSSTSRTPESSAQSAGARSASASPAAPAVPDEIQKVAEASLGSETEVLVYGDLSKTGPKQVLAVNRLKTTPEGIAPGILVNRLVILQSNGGAWKEVLRADEHLENAKGFLGGIPLAPINGWRLQLDQDDPKKGLVMYFSPIVAPKGGHIVPLGVRWNPEVKRYQSLDSTFQQFLSEVPQLETPESQVRL